MFDNSKTLVRDFWQESSCGEKLYLKGGDQEDYNRQSQIRYQLEPYIEEFAQFSRWKGKKILEIGVGLGADHQRFAEAQAQCYGIDLTPRAIERVKDRFAKFGLHSELNVGDAEMLRFPKDYFDLIYSWGVIHHSPNTSMAAQEILRVLKPGGTFKVMVYNRHSLVGYMLWIRYALLTLRPLRSLDEIYAAHLESPGTKAYNFSEVRALFAGAKDLKMKTVMTHADLLESQVGQRHRSLILNLAKNLWPRRLLKKILPTHGLFLLVEGKKPNIVGT